MSAVDIFGQAFVDAINSPNPRLLYAVRINYSNPVLAHTGVGDIVINNETYLGVGNLGEIGTVNDDNSTSPAQLTLSLSGLDPTLAAQVLNQRNNNKAVRIYWVVLDENERVIDSALIFSGKTTDQQYLYDKENAAIQVTAADRLIDWSRKATNRYTDESHRSEPLSLGDRIFRYIIQMAERPIYWGSAKDAPGFRY